MVTPGRHPKNPINKALRGLDPVGFVVIEIHRGHRWGEVVCRICGASQVIWSTPRVPEHGAHEIVRFARRHAHEE